MMIESPIAGIFVRVQNASYIYLTIVGTLIAKKDTNYRKNIPAKKALLLHLECFFEKFRMFFRMYYNYLILFH